MNPGVNFLEFCERNNEIKRTHQFIWDNVLLSEKKPEYREFPS